MKQMLGEIRRSILVTLVLTAVCCGAYPILVFGLSQAIFPRQANGNLIVNSEGTVQGSRLIGQPFTGAKYFHPRPSTAGNGYDATSSGGSNLGPTSRKLRDRIERDVAAFRASNGLADVALPADSVTASASGLDPHISPENAILQAPRVAKARDLPLEKVLRIIREHTDTPDLGFLGNPGINVLELNLALDRLGQGGARCPEKLMGMANPREIGYAYPSSETRPGGERLTTDGCNPTQS
jgi:K+-transporting ATPase ATPase C chain